MNGRLKHRWSVGNNHLAGITAGTWWRLLRENGFAVDWPYWHRAAFITLTSLLNSFYRWREDRRYGEQIEQAEVTHPPLFILGHWRTGTTLLHYLLAQHTEQFGFANTYQVVNPYTFLTTEEVNIRRFGFLVPRHRPMDRMEQSFTTPQEDEVALLLLSLRSLYLGISFPRQAEWYSRYLTFRTATPTEVSEWKRALLWFAKKLSLKYDRSLLFKSPPHTARVRLLLEIFPNAKFVHIHRNPYDVFQSSRHYFDTAPWYTYLQRPDIDQIDEGIITRYQVLYDAFFEDRPLLNDGQFWQVRFEDLERDPVEEVRRLYGGLGLPGFETFRPRLEQYVGSLSSYRKNGYPDLVPAWRTRIAEAWEKTFAAWGYAT